MFANVADSDWGAWVLGDAPHVLDMACSSVGHGTEVVSASVVLPREDQALPQVRLVLPHDRAVTRLRQTLLEDGVILRPDQSTGDEEYDAQGAWLAELPGIELTVQVRGWDR